MKLLHNFFPFVDFLYILQLEEYYSKFYFKSIRRLWFKRHLQKRGKLVYTKRVKTTFFLSFLFFAGVVVVLSFTPFTLLGALLLSSLLIPLHVGLSNIILAPIYNRIRDKIQKEAKVLLKNHPDVKIIAVAGSYGKTTTKNFIYQLIRFSYKVQMVPGNINTPTGIAAWLLKNYDQTTHYLIVEMDAYEKGEIAASCAVAKPDIAILTSIGDQHLMRFKTTENLAVALSEVITHSKESSTIIASSQTLSMLKHYGITVKRNIIELTNYQKIAYEGKLLVQPDDYSDSIKQSLQYAIAVANLLDVPFDFVKDSVSKLEIPDRRHNLTTSNGYMVIDDSYNISPTTALNSLKTAKGFAKNNKKLLVVITGGIPELGPENIQANEIYGQKLIKTADFVLLLNTTLSTQIQSTFSSSDAKKHKVVNNLSQAWAHIENNFDPKKTVILLQPELNDLYY